MLGKCLVFKEIIEYDGIYMIYDIVKDCIILLLLVYFILKCVFRKYERIFLDGYSKS